MNVPAPQSAAAGLWNRLKVIGGDDGKELDRIIWQLRGLATRQPADFVARLALAWAWLMRGRRGEALPHVEAAFGLSHGQGSASGRNAASVLLDAGLLREARAILTRLLDTPEAAGDVNLFAAAIAFALRVGDLAFFKRAINATRVDSKEAEAFVSMLEKEGMADAFRRHQEIVESILGSRTCTFAAGIGYDDEGTLGVSLEYHTELRGRPRLELYRSVAEATMGDDLVIVSRHVTIGIWGPQVQALESAA